MFHVAWGWGGQLWWLARSRHGGMEWATERSKAIEFAEEKARKLAADLHAHAVPASHRVVLAA